MAIFVDPVVGDTVYVHASRPGIVKSVDDEKIVIVWIDGSTTYVTGFDRRMKSFDELIKDHEKKINTHKTNLEKLKRLKRNEIIDENPERAFRRMLNHLVLESSKLLEEK